jgi:hypothetical protein
MIWRLRQRQIHTNLLGINFRSPIFVWRQSSYETEEPLSINTINRKKKLNLMCPNGNTALKPSIKAVKKMKKI